MKGERQVWIASVAVGALMLGVVLVVMGLAAGINPIR